VAPRSRLAPSTRVSGPGGAGGGGGGASGRHSDTAFHDLTIERFDD
jgi:hypothetical protein